MPLPQISLGSEPLDTSLVSRVEVVQELNGHWRATVVLRDTADRRPQVEAQAARRLRISTLGADGVETVLFQGPVRRMRLLYEAAGPYGAELEAVSASWRMAQGARFRYYPRQTAQAAASALLGAAGLALAGAMPAGATLSYVQWEETDFSFVSRLIDDTEAWFRPALDGADGLEVRTEFAPGPTLAWRTGEYGLLAWSAHGGLGPIAASGAHYDYRAMRSRTSTGVRSEPAFFDDAASPLVAATRSASAALGPMGASRHRADTLDAHTALLEREARRGMASAVVCTGRSREPRVRAGDTVVITGLPGVDATYGVSAVEHRWTRTGYENTFTATPARRWSPPERPRRPSFDGLYTGRVVANHDPHNQGRVRLRYWWQEANETAWVRLLSPHAGTGRGILFLPEIGEEVYVAFEEGDPERPYVVASAWNGVHRPPAAGFHKPDEVNGSEFASNAIKRLVTKSGHRITFVDTPGKATISIATPRSAQLLLTDAHEETGGRPAVVLHSEGDLFLSAPNGRIHQRSLLQSREVGAGVQAIQPTTTAASSKTILPPASTLNTQMPATKPDCAFLDPKQSRVMASTERQFDQNRRPASLSAAAPLKYSFPGGTSPQSATKQTVTIGGKSIDLIKPENGPSVANSVLPADEQVAKSLGAIPENQLKYVSSVVLSPNPSPDDAYWAKTYHSPGFQTEANCGKDGVVRFFPISNNVPMIPDETFVHESGHAFSKNIWPANADWEPWVQAGQADGQSPSKYATSSKDEDFSESLVMYRLSKGTACESKAQAMFPHRYAILDHLLAPKGKEVPPTK